MIDLHDKTISFSLNGELMLDNLGNETTFDGLEMDEIGFVPALTSFSGQKARLNFGQDVNTLKYFTSCGLQEGYEPFCVNMSRSLTFWYSNFIPRFETIKSNSTSFEITRVGASRDNPPLIKLQSRLFGTLEKVEFEFLRLSLPLSCHDQFTDRQLTLNRRQMALHEYIESQEEKRTFAFPPSALTGIRTKSLAPGTTDTIDSHLSSQADGNPNFLSPDSIMNKSTRNPTNLLVKFRDQTGSKKSPSPSPPSTPLLNGLSQTHLTNGTSNVESTERLNKSNMKQSTNKVSNFFQRFSKEPHALNDPQGKASKRTVKLSGTSTTSTGTNSQIPPQSVLKIPTINTLQPGGQASKRQSNTAGNARRSFLDPDGDIIDQQGNDFDHDDIRAINEHVHEYYYAIRILPGQNPRSVFIGWVTSRFKPILKKENLQDDTLTPAKKLAKLIRRCTITQTGEDGSILESVIRQDAYMFCASDLLENMPDKEAVARRVVNGLLIGCLCDISTGQLTFYVNGKESAQKLEVYTSKFFYQKKNCEIYRLNQARNCIQQCLLNRL
jgi:ryanodine receptor 2